MASGKYGHPIPWNALFPLACKGCGLPKARDDFGDLRGQRSPKRSCRACSATRIQQWAERHPEAVRKTQKEWAARHPEVNRRSSRRQHANMQEKTLPHATRQRQGWTGAQIEVANRRDITAIEAGLMLGRSAKAIYHIRARIDARDPRTLSKLGYDPNKEN